MVLPEQPPSFANSDRCPPGEIPPVLLTGFLNSPLGLGQVARALAKALQTEGLTFEAYDVPLRHLQTIDDVQAIEAEPGKHLKICLCSINGEHFPNFARIVGNAFFEGRHIIGIWFWETPELPESARRGLPYVDEVWTCSTFTAESIRQALPDLPVRVFPYPLTVAHPLLNLELGSGLPVIAEGAFVFLLAFDFNSCVRRKNPDAVAQAFCQAFPDPDPAGAVCVIKSSHGDKHSLEFERLRKPFADRPDVIFYDGFLPSGAMDALMNRANCYVSLHRAEGFGLTLLESMGGGKPCIASAYSGNLSFMTPENSWLIPVKMSEVGLGSRHYPPGHVWGDPDVAAAAAAMRECFIGGPGVRLRTSQAQQDIAEVYAMENAARTVRGFLLEAAERVPSRKKLPSQQSAYERAREQLARSAELESGLDNGNSIRGFRWPGKMAKAFAKLFRENRRTSELILKASREKEAELGGRIAQLEAQLEDTRRCLAEVLRKQEP